MQSLYCNRFRAVLLPCYLLPCRQKLLQQVYYSSYGVQGLPRLIEIEGVDLHACGGTHVSCTSELQVLKVLGWEKHKGQARVHFIAGGRVTAALGSALSREACLNKVTYLNLIISCFNDTLYSEFRDRACMCAYVDLSYSLQRLSHNFCLYGAQFIAQAWHHSESRF